MSELTLVRTRDTVIVDDLVRGEIFGPYDFDLVEDEAPFDPIDLTGCSFIGQVRRDAFDSPVEGTFSFSILDDVNGNARLWMSGAQLIDTDMNNQSSLKLYGEVFLVDSTSEKTLMFRIEFNLKEKVTEWA